ncbi:hypothetical protein CCO03_00380 [Comamonas serinivorans]|uniref:Uncharacterized protein n=1 Tax=Comamonas serinivorans TaxID=1082851 RepID=A0A1Y0EIU7_9BURK|nr:hypothetical protein CCO03_00380 [Comamonas serinivorans]
MLQGPQRLRVCVVRLVALKDDAAPEAREFVVSRSLTELAPPAAADAGTVRASSESTLTPLPLTLAGATDKAVDFVRHRVAMGDALSAQSGFAALVDLCADEGMSHFPIQPPSKSADTDLASNATLQDPAVAPPAAGPETIGLDGAPASAALPAAPPSPDRPDTPAARGAGSPTSDAAPAAGDANPARWHFPLAPQWLAQRKPPRGEAEAVATLVAQFAPGPWAALPAKQQARRVWRVAERFDAARRDQAAQQRLYRLVPQLVSLLESGDDLLDYTLAWALARLQDPGAAQALAALAQHGRSEATRGVAAYARHLLLVRAGTPDEARAALAPLVSVRGALLQHLATLASPAVSQAQRHTARNDTQRNAVREAVASLGHAQALALIDPTVHAALGEALASAHWTPELFAAVRQVYQRAELAQDWALLAVLHARLERDRAMPQPDRHPSAYRDPRTGLYQTRWARGHDHVRGYSTVARDYFCTRTLRTLRRLAEVGHSEAPQLAVALLLALPSDAPASDARFRDSVYAQAHRWSVAGLLLLDAHPEWRTHNHRLRLGNHGYPNLREDALPEQRLDGLQPLWDANPQAVLQLLRTSGNRLVQWVMARALRDQRDWLAVLPPAPIGELLASRFALTAELGLDVVQAHLARARDATERLRWWRALARSAHPRAAQVLAQDLAPHLAALPQAPDLLAALLYSPSASNRALGYSVMPMNFSSAGLDTAPLMNEVLALLPSLDDEHADAQAIAHGLQQWLAGAWAGCAPQVAPAPLLALLADPALPVVQVASTWVALHPQALAHLPASHLQALLGSPELARRVCGMRLLASLPMTALREQAELLFEGSQSPSADMRGAVRNAIERLAADPQGHAACAWLAQRLHASLFRSEPAEGVHADTLALLLPQPAPAGRASPSSAGGPNRPPSPPGLADPAGGPAPLAAFAPGLDADSVWRALQAQAAGAQRYGALALSQMGSDPYTLRQWATLGRHADVDVRARARARIDALLSPLSATTPEQADALLPLADSLFDDSQAYARQLLGERLPDSALSPELLIRWVDHPRDWVQALGRQRLMRHMGAAEASLCLTRLAQHPSVGVQQFVTQWLLALPDEPAPQRAARLAQLQPYFLSVLSQVHRGRVSKTRVQAFLRQQIEAPETAAVVAEVYARQVVGAGRLDQPQYMAGLRDIAARHPQLPLPCLQWQPPPARAPRTQAADRLGQA